MKLKICGTCKELKPLNEFYKNKYNKDGLTYFCKACRRKRYLEKEKEKEGGIDKDILYTISLSGIVSFILLYTVI